MRHVTISFSTLKMLSEGLLPVFCSLHIYRGVPQQNATTDKTMTPQGMANPRPQPNMSWMYDMMEFPKRLPLHIAIYQNTTTGRTGSSPGSFVQLAEIPCHLHSVVGQLQMLATKGCIHPAQLRSSTVAKTAKKMASMSAALPMRLNLLGPDQ